MMQRYIVFLDEKAVIIHQDINMPVNHEGDINIEFTDANDMAEAFQRFRQDREHKSLNILASEDFAAACKEFNNLFTRIEAAGGIVRNRSHEYLFIKRMGLWDLPKGKLHKGESAEEGALREVMEETGLSDLTISRQLPSTCHIYTGRKGEEILKETYWFEMINNQDQELVPQTEEDITEVKWFSDKDLHIPLHTTYASLKHLMAMYLHREF